MLILMILVLCFEWLARNETEINGWLYADKYDTGYSHLNDDEIVALATEERDPQEEMNGDEAD